MRTILQESPRPNRWLWRWRRWLPWRWLVSRLAQEHGFLDPLVVLARVRRFSQPTEVDVPTELLRAGIVMHARGLMNSQAIQHNLDWVWPYWAVRQFSPTDDAFIPWAFSVAHINLTNRNWTAVGVPDVPWYPLIDPRGLVTPLFDGWSLDTWLVTQDGRWLLPSRAPSARQRLDLGAPLAVETTLGDETLGLQTRVWVPAEEPARCRIRAQAWSDASGWLVTSLRPYNPEGVSFIHDVQPHPDRPGWRVNRGDEVVFAEAPERMAYSSYRTGDVYRRLPAAKDSEGIACDVGMATAAALFPVAAGRRTEVVVDVPLEHSKPKATSVAMGDWTRSLDGHAALRIPDPRMQFLYEAAIRTLVLHAPGDVYPGPYTYRRFWFRDAAYILHGLLAAGLVDRAARALERFPSRQTLGGYFESQEGEWDSNGQVLWIFRRFEELTGQPLEPAWRAAIEKGARWIIKKRLPDVLDAPHAGLLPAGFSAEHLGPNDYYYWDDFWTAAGLRAAAASAKGWGDEASARAWLDEADRLMRAIERSLQLAAARLGRPALPASPTRRFDAGAIGSLAVGYPLQLWRPDDPRVLDTVEFLLRECFVRGGFFQTMSHAGINPYLTLHAAQVLLRAGDPRGLTLVQRIAELASPTGQWPEAIHPRTLGGCMGDGQHVWAAAEWVLVLRNSFVREEGDGLVLGAGLPEAWWSTPLAFGPTPTAHGPVTVHTEPIDGGLRIRWDGRWRAAAPLITVRLPGRPPAAAASGQTSVEVRSQ